MELKTCFQALFLRKLRSSLSTLGVLFGVAAVVAMQSIGEGAKQETLEQIAQLGVNAIIVRQIDLTEAQLEAAREQGSQGLTFGDAEALERGVPHVRFNAPVKVVKATITGLPQEMSPEILAVTDAFREVKNLSLAEGRFICAEDVRSRHLVCVLGHDVAAGLQEKGQKGHVGSSVRIEDVEYLVVGRLRERNWSQAKSAALASRNMNKCVYIPLGSEAASSLTEIVVQGTDSSCIDAYARAIDRVLEVRHSGVEDYQIVVPRELLSQASRTQNTYNLVLGSIAAVSLLVGGIGIMNIMLANVSERTREIGIRRAVGANQRHIVNQFLLETLVLTLLGGVLGVLLGGMAAYVISVLAQWKTIVTVRSIVLALGMACGVGLASGLYPAAKAAAMDPITALRYD